LLSYISTQPFLYWIIFYSMHVRLLYANKVQFSSVQFTTGWPKSETIVFDCSYI